jgi:hypothetical protein
MHKKVFIDSIINFTKNNIKYIDHIDIKITNPNKISIFRPKMYEATLVFKKNDMSVYQNFSNDNFEDLIANASDFISKEIKV